MNYSWNFSVVAENLPVIFLGARLTMMVSIAVMIVSLILGLTVALLRISRSRILRGIARGYTEFFRATPALVQVVWIFYALPLLIGVTLSPIVAGITALSLNLSAFVSEVYRAGILAVPSGVREASLALGHRPLQTMRRILVPLALRRMIPPLGTLWIALFKDSSILSIIGVHELMYETRVLAVEEYRPLEVFTAAAVIYFLITCPQAVGVEYLYHRFRPKD